MVAGRAYCATLFAAKTDASDSWLVYLLFIVAGFLVGGTWAAWQAKKMLLVIVTGVLAVAACATAILWLVGEMT